MGRSRGPPRRAPRRARCYSATYAGGRGGRAEAALGVLEKALAGKEYLLGREFSAADIMMGYTLLSARAFGVLTDRHLNVSAYRARLEVRPALQRRCRRRERERVREAPSGVEAPPRSRSRHPTSPRMSSPSLTPTSSISAAPTATRARATPSSTTSYTSSTTRARWRSSSTTAPSRLDVRAEAVRRLQGTATRARTARAGGRRSAGDGETPRAGRGRVS